LVVIADPQLLLERAQQIHLPLKLRDFDPTKSHRPHEAGSLTILPIALATKAEAGTLNPINSPYVIKTLETAAALCQQKMADALITGPVHKSVINAANIPFTGHTEFFAAFCQVPQTVMLFVVDKLKVAIATTHVPLADVAKTLTKDRLRSTLCILNQALKEQFHFAKPRLLICGLNPHAGENGYLGREEIDVITPVLNELRAENFLIEGPLSADTIFTPKYLENADVVLAMYHDQALPLVKYLGFGHAVNVTLGLPFTRTSVDHGTALDIAGSGKADAGSLAAAIKLALVSLQNGHG